VLDGRKVQTPQIISEFKETIDSFCAQFSAIGFQIPGYRGGDVHIFANSTLAQQVSALANLRNYVSIYGGALEEKITPANEARLLWYSLHKWGYRPTSDLFDKIEMGDFIEVYNTDNIQVHRSFNFFQLSSYTLEEIFLTSWADLYERDSRIEKGILRIVHDIFTEKQRGTVYSGLDIHYLREAKSEEKRVYKASHNIFSPLKDFTGRQTAFVVLSKAELGTIEEFNTTRNLDN
jgi:hypothetical protein